MRLFTRLVKRWLGDSRGTTLAELMLAMTIGAFIIAAVFAVMVSLFHVTTTNSNYMAAFRQVQDAGDWITRDALMAQQVSAMTSTALTLDIDEDDTVIPVDSTIGFPDSGIVSIEDEIIRYTGIDNTDPDNPKFTGCIRGDNATAHEGGKLAGFLVAVDWVTWSGNHHQVFYNLKASNGRLARSYLVNGTLTSYAVIAEAIDPSVTTSQWDYPSRELSVAITANVGKYMPWKSGEWESTATRTYKINPRPFY